MSKPILVVEALGKRFGSVVAVDNVSFGLGRGEVLGLLGPNGAGKTTTIQMLLAVLTPTSGRIAYFGLELGRARERILERVNFSSAYNAIPGNLRVSDSLSFLSRLYALPDRRARLDELIATFDLEPLLARRAVTLSAGEQARVGLAKAFINRPDVLLLDEPTASLDPETAHRIRDYVLAERKRSGLSVLFTSHNMAEVEAMCDRVIFIDGGRVVANDTPRNLARTLDRCIVTLRLDPEDRGRQQLDEVCSRLGLTAGGRGDEVEIELRDAQIPSFVQGLVGAAVPMYGLEIQRSTLEQFFVQQARKRAAEPRS
jgi:ABC-2 type transport system ATP-binding protein